MLPPAEQPWGCYDPIDHGERFQVKRIVVKPGGRLSLATHYQGAEHWTVVRRIARAKRGEETFLLTENQSNTIPLGALQRLDNPGETPRVLIEVQSGCPREKDDIVPFDEQYGRAAG